MSHRFFEEIAGVYFDDLDTFHVLHNARYLLLFERAIGAFWMELGLGDFTDNPDEQFHMVRHNEMEYLAPVKGVGRVRVRLWIEKLGNTSLTFAFRLMPLDRDELCAKAARDGIPLSWRGGRMVPVPRKAGAALTVGLF